MRSTVENGHASSLLASHGIARPEREAQREPEHDPYRQHDQRAPQRERHERSDACVFFDQRRANVTVSGRDAISGLSTLPGEFPML